MTITSILKQSFLFLIQMGSLAVVQVCGFVLYAQLAGVMPSQATTPVVKAYASLSDSSEQTSMQASGRRGPTHLPLKIHAWQARMFGILVSV